MIPDWQLPTGVDRGLHDYLHSREMVENYDQAMAVSALASIDIAFCEKHFSTKGRLIDLGCGTGRLAHHFADRGFECVGVDLSDEMLAAARQRPSSAQFQIGNLTKLEAIADGSFDYAACLFSTLGMIRGFDNRMNALAEFKRILRPQGRFVLHFHNRYFVRELGFRGFRSHEITMPQAYGGAPLTLTHWGLDDMKRLLKQTGFRILDVLPVSPAGILSHRWLVPGLRAYGYLIACGK